MEKAEINNPTFRDLTLCEAWALIKIFFGSSFVCAFIFVLPYLLLTKVGDKVEVIEDGKIITQWIGWLFVFTILLWIVFRIYEFFSWFGKFFMDLANLTKSMSKVTRVIFAVLFLLYFYCWSRFGIATFFVTVLVLIPAELTYNQYKSLLEDKIPHEDL